MNQAARMKTQIKQITTIIRTNIQKSDSKEIFSDVLKLLLLPYTIFKQPSYNLQVRLTIITAQLLLPAHELCWLMLTQSENFKIRRNLVLLIHKGDHYFEVCVWLVASECTSFDHYARAKQEI